MISVIVPIYNVSLYLEQCIQSICSQTYQDLEIILVDDGSTDNCPEICEAYRQKDPRIRVIHQPNSGLVSARQAGIQAATGEFVGYVDGDDWTEPDMYEQMYQAITGHSVDVVMCGRYENTGSAQRPVYHGVDAGMYDRKRLLREVYPQMVTQTPFFQWGIFPNVWDKLFRREKLLKFQMQVDRRITVGEDAACVYPYLLHAMGIYVLRECLYHYRQIPSSMVKRREAETIERERFRTLYRTVYQQTEKDRPIFDFSDQWKKYMLFLLIPRADCIYSGFAGLNYLFPFPRVMRGSKIVLYCAGTYGQRLYSFLKSTRFCEVVLWVDRNYTHLRHEGLPVESPDQLSRISGYDAIVVANMFGRSREALYQDLIKKYPAEKVHLIDESLIFSEETAKALDLFM